MDLSRADRKLALLTAKPCTCDTHPSYYSPPGLAPDIWIIIVIEQNNAHVE